MPVFRYRSIHDMPRPWRHPDDPANLRLVGEMLALHRALTREVVWKRGVMRYRSVQEAEADRADRAT